MIAFTWKQTEILMAIQEGKPDGSFVSVYDIMEKISYEVKRDALLHSIKVLVDNGFVERKDKVIQNGKSVRLFGLTSLGYTYL